MSSLTAAWKTNWANEGYVGRNKHEDVCQMQQTLKPKLTKKNLEEAPKLECVLILLIKDCFQVAASGATSVRVRS